MNGSMPGLPVHHQLPEFTQTYVHSCMDRGTSQATVQEVEKELDTTERLSLSYKIYTCMHPQKHIITLMDHKIELIFQNYLWDKETYMAIRYISQTFLYKSNVVKTVMGSETLCHLEVSDVIQPSHPLSSPSPPAPNPSQHQSLFQWVNSSHEVAKVLEFQL